MGRNIGPKNKIARRFKANLGLKTNANKVARRLNQAPGVHGPNQRRVTLSAFGKQLLEKQKAKAVYGIRERQFRKYVEKANNMVGDSGVNLQEMLEMRMDNVVYRLGFATTRAQARQFVGHSMFLLNGKKMNIPSHIVHVGDVVSLKENKQKKQIFENVSDRLQAKELASWISVDAAAKSGKILTKPMSKDFERVYDVKLITEYYSTR
ncbi:MAG: 30S ribosomal protein S4 [Candidatus Magasanikbacteria bacterium CG_4_10_14_0_8_um_filter_32_14]|uniref:Small ribosomal subunit protein uS4 n=1 Tax=Candidatus Magasanikbacteria bacterium CG_4_10_14_0_8_um_filter_32_14 TaxID=1974640 RepID=A0A2M7R8W4_9BACT|nr:MAG: 30S ribosomal protein S4 [Candidatus Magasanikbacteria bacterium CG_4_10_14_0_8_um_filter_32_14]